MTIAPARMMSSEQTVARIGRRMKRLLNISAPSCFAGRRRRRRGARARRRHGDGHAVADLLNARHDQLLAFLQPAQHDVVVADDRSQLHRSLPRDGRAALALLDDVARRTAR